MPASRATSRRLSVDTLRCGPISFKAAAIKSSREIEALRPMTGSPSACTSGWGITVMGWAWTLSCKHHIGVINIQLYTRVYLYLYSACHECACQPHQTFVQKQAQMADSAFDCP